MLSGPCVFAAAHTSRFHGGVPELARSGQDGAASLSWAPCVPGMCEDQLWLCCEISRFWNVDAKRRAELDYVAAAERGKSCVICGR